jgi:hypothetical protein
VNVAGSWLVGCGTALASLAMGYSITAWLAVRRRIHPAGGARSNAPPVTVLKPLTRTVRGRDGHFRVTRNGAFQPGMRRAPGHRY